MMETEELKPVGYVTKDVIAELSEERIGGYIFPAGTLRPENEVALYDATALRLLTEEVEKLKGERETAIRWTANALSRAETARDEWRIAVNQRAAAETEAASLRQKLDVAREALKPFVTEFTTRRDAYARRYKDRDLGYANFDKMPDRWPMEKCPFNMGVFRRAQDALTTLDQPHA